MNEKHPIEDLMITAMSSIKEMIDVNTIIGEPIKALNNTVIIPISKVGFGFAAGGSEFNGETVNTYNKKEKEENINYRLPFGGGSGAGVNISPVAFLIVQNDNVKLIEATHSSVLDKLVEYIPDVTEKISDFFKKKMNGNLDFDDNYYDEVDDEFDEELDNYNDSVDSEEDEQFERVKIDEDDSLDEEFEKDFEAPIKMKDSSEKSKAHKEKDVKKIKVKSKQEFNKNMDDSKGNVKMFEEKIKAVKNEG